MKKFMIILSLVFVAFAASACTQNTNEIKIGVVNWSDSIAISNLAKVIAEDELGYDVTLTMVDVGPVYASVADGDYDYFLDAWLPTTQASYIEEFGDDFVQYSTIFEGTLVGLVVPAYVEIDSIAELNAVADDFDGEIVGIDSGAGIMGLTETAITTYDLTNFELQVGSGPVMTAALADAISNEEAIVVTGWQPHWKFGAWDLKFLEDPEGVYGDPEYIKSIARTGAADDFPAFAAFLDNFELTSEQLNGLMSAINESSDDAIDVARDWAEDNADAVAGWLEGVN